MANTSPPNLSTLVIIGQPPVDLADLCFSGQAERTIVIEPDPERAVEIETRLAGATGVQILTAAPWTDKHQPELTTFNFPGLRSLYAPNEKLKQLLPGLKPRDKILVESISLKELTAQLRELQSPAHVVINLPGSEHQILDFWRKNGFLENISQLDLTCGSEAFFHESKSATELQELLTENGFYLFFQEGEDPDWVRLTFRVNPLISEVADLQKKLELLEVTLAETKQQLDEQAQATNTAQLETSETQSAMKEMRAALSDRDAALVEAEAETEAQGKAVAVAQKRAAEAEAALEELRTVLAEKGQTDSIEQEEALQQAKEDLSIALRMQSVLQSDLFDLRQRFAQSERQRRAQEDLLSKLTPRLQQAAEQIRYLSLPGENLEPAETPGDGK